MSLSVAPTRLKELLNMVYHKGQSWDLNSSASILMTYLCIYQILQNFICSRMTEHFINKKKASCKFKKFHSFVLIVFQCGATLITCSLILGKTKSMVITTRQKLQFFLICNISSTSIPEKIKTSHRLRVSSVGWMWRSTVNCI